MICRNKFFIPLRRSVAGYRRFLTGFLFLAAAVAAALPLPVFANDLFEDRAWQFETTTERAHKAAVLDLILRKKAGMYKNTYNNTYNTTYDISGHYIDCNMTSQSLGNQGTANQQAPVGSPSLGVSSSTSSSTIGNSGTGTVTAGGATSGLTSSSGENSDPTNTSTAGGANTVSTNQSNDGSSQNSSAYDNTFSSTVSGVSGTGGGASVALNSNQSMADSQVTSTISDSSSCDFNVVSGSVGSPINSGGGQ